MADISVANLTKYYGANLILDHVSFDIFEGEKIGLVGKNGSGKTTLVKLLAGELAADEGTVAVAPGRRLAATDQIPVFPRHFTVSDVLKSAFYRLDAMAAEMERLAKEMARNPVPALVKKHGELEAAYAALGGYETGVALAKTVQGLKFPPELLERPFFLLSGGEKTRVNMARMILDAPDILLLDEPTNHLDMDAASWLESFVAGYKGTVLIVSHDRFFLDRTVKRVFEIDHGKMFSYDGNYTRYAETRAAKRREQARLYERQQEEIRRLTETAARLHGWGTQSVKMHRRAFSIEKRIGRMERLERPRAERGLSAKFSSDELLTDEMARVRGLYRAFGERELFSGLDFTVRNGDRLGVIGKNGTGKTTLLRLLLSLDRPDKGTVSLAPGTRPAYLPQAVSFKNESRTLIDTLLYEKALTTQECRDLLGAFGFSGDAQMKKVSALSGGEKSRLYLCMLMADPVNLLVLDEPTNHLDIPSREWIEQAVESFSGTLIFVSHDRYFLDRFANRILTLDETDERRYFKGSFREFLAFSEKSAPAPAPPRPPAVKTPEKKEKKVKKEDKRFVKELAAAERDIEAMERRRTENQAQMEQNATDPEKLLALSAEAEEISRALALLYDRWQELAEQAEP